MKHDPRRRRLLRALAGLPFLSGLPGDLLAQIAPAASPSSVVARSRREGLAAGKGKLDPGKLEESLGAVLARAAGEENAVDALRRLFRPEDVVGIKLNCLAGRGLSPNPLLIERLTRWLREAGLPARNILVWDRTDRELKAAGFEIVRTGDGVRCAGTNDDYDSTSREWGAGSSRFARVLVEDLTALINVGVLKDHNLSGVSLGLKNWYGAIHNPHKHHEDRCAPFIPHLAAFPLIRNKLRLTIIDGNVAQCHGGPMRDPSWKWPWQGIMASTDPVALDAVGWRMIESRRRKVDLPSLSEEGREPRWIADAAALGLGEADTGKIEVVDL
jgi:uncharacterized protein (DUF362 family)